VVSPDLDVLLDALELDERSQAGFGLPSELEVDGLIRMDTT